MSHGPIVFSTDAAAASGTLAEVFTADVQGQGPCRLTIKNVGSANLTAAKVQLGPDADHLTDLDTSTFASLASGGGIAQLRIPEPVNVVRLLATCATGTTLDVRLSRSLDAD